ncbi:MAG: phosphoglycolate phosphatase [Salibaculum sp.]|jgi:phosphoglycolate phosphatase|uniref:phosphoglycolate phosphatase n=1 Tax=Salibaculum sp. TaxID=2855480 RepID=UPI002870A9C6|nr:phosphoglycolate phosphatase [Salibaculum sp.]MDR9428224.1 phosphoglycolate phosphatase [Salibaculum sp.]
MARIVFDLDGTLIDSVFDIHEIANDILAEFGVAPITLDQARDFIGNGVTVFVERMRAARDIPETEQPRLLAAFMARYHGAVRLTQPYPGVVTMLDALAEAGHRLGVCTNKPLKPTQSVLAHLALDRFFGTVWGGDSLSVNKPDPAPLHAAFAALGDGPRVYVGDSDVDAKTARRAEVPFLLFTEGYRKCPVRDMPHDVAFSDYAALPDLVQRVTEVPT